MQRNVVSIANGVLQKKTAKKKSLGFGTKDEIQRSMIVRITRA